MLTFLYYLPFVWISFLVCLFVFNVFLNKNQKNHLGLNEPAIWLYWYVIPILIVCFTFYFVSHDFKEMYVPWTILGISFLLHIAINVYIQIQRGKAANALVTNALSDLTNLIKKRKQEEENQNK